MHGDLSPFVSGDVAEAYVVVERLARLAGRAERSQRVRLVVQQPHPQCYVHTPTVAPNYKVNNEFGAGAAMQLHGPPQEAAIKRRLLWFIKSHELPWRFLFSVTIPTRWSLLLRWDSQDFGHFQEKY